ncbi:hypothetical protein LRS05_14025 [Flavobacterium sp. J372]|uniref:hypothetical protein n=1 Tax=Flavobacterium sp. J372 TaxID=2898436 RepID=UPI002151BC9F|nr:hypothetical protein [Flavobacterium sp. J372]MCR5863174.1 hypothetical protein [Flavobacterium sp. J372]
MRTIKLMIPLFIIIAFTTLGCFNNQPNSNKELSIKSNQDTLVYLNNDYKMTIYSNEKAIYGFKLYNIHTSVKIEGTPEIILVEGEIPEGSLREDHNNPQDYKGYECSSAYQYIANEIKVVFALEKLTKDRLDLGIYNSFLNDFSNGDFTLVKQSYN